MTIRVLQLEAGIDFAKLDDGLSVTVQETVSSVQQAAFQVAVSGRRFLRTDGAQASGNYASQVTPYTSLIAALRVALDAGGSAGYAVTFDDDAGRITVSHSGAGNVDGFTLTMDNATTRRVLGFATGPSSSALSHTGRAAPWYWIGGEIGYWAGDGLERGSGRQDPTAVDLEASDGTPYGMSRTTRPKYWRADIPLEPIERVQAHRAPVSIPWTWEHFFEHCSNIEPFVLIDGAETRFLKLRAQGVDFDPQARSPGFHRYVDIPLDTRVLGRIAYLMRYAEGETAVEPVNDGAITIAAEDVPVELLTDGFTMRVRFDFASSAARDPYVFWFDASNFLRVANSGANSVVQLRAGTLYASAAFSHPTATEADLTVDFSSGGSLSLVDTSNGATLASIASLGSDDWSGMDGTDLLVGHSGAGDRMPARLGAPRP